MRPAGWVLGAALLALAAGRMSAGDTAQDILKKVRDKYDSVTDAEIKFQQRVRMPVGKLEQTTAGTQRTASAVDELNALASELKGSVAGFKVD